jgi:hypothetical protein
VTTSRIEIAEIVGDAFEGGPVTKSDLLAAARDRQARAEVLAQLERLPEGPFKDLRSLWPELPGVPVSV